MPNRPFPEKGKFRVGVVMVGAPLKIHWAEARERKGGLSWYPEVYVSYRLDDGRTVDDEWPPRFDKASVEFEKGEFKKMLRARTVLINDAR